MNLLFVTNSLDVGGIETNLVRLVRRFRSLGHQVIVASAGGALQGELQEAEGEHLTLGMRTTLASVVRDSRLLAEVITDRSPDVIHSFSAPASIRAWLGTRLSTRHGEPLVVSSVMGLMNRPQEPKWRWLLRVWLTTLGARKVFSIAPTIRAALESLPIAPQRIVDVDVVGVDEVSVPPEDVGRVRAEFDVQPGQPLITTAGALAPRKSHDLFVLAAQGVLRRHPEAHFAIAGSGPLEPDLRRLILELGLSDRVHLLGSRRDVPALLAASNVYVRPGVVEGFVGITVLEAQMVGTPVVSFDTQDVRLAIMHESTGLLVAHDPDSLAAAICQLIEDEEVGRDMAAEASQAVRRRFTIEAVVDGLLRAYQDLGAASPRRT